MFTISIGGQIETVYENKDINVLVELEEELEVLRTKHKAYYNIVCSHDIETTSIINETNDTHLRYDSLPYHFQTCIGKYVFFQRTLTDYQYFINQLKSIFTRGKLILFVHNLQFEFQHEKHLFDWFTEDENGEKVSTVFSKDGRKVMKATTGNIEFRCSYMLTNKSLAKLTQTSKTCVHKKLDGEIFDYTKFRTPKTELEEYELMYNYNDVKGLVECIEELLETRVRPNGKKYTLLNLPLTSTGFVRDKFKANARAKDADGKKYRAKLRDCEISLEEYKILSDYVFRGGDTHAKYPFGNKLLHNVGSFDLKSSYPAVLFYGKYPITKFRKYKNHEFYEKLLEKKACYGLFRFDKIKCKSSFHNPYLSISKCNYAKGSIIDNGRLFYSDYCYTWLTDIDFKIVRDLYDFESVEVIGDLRCAEYGYLPNVLRNTLLEYWDKKCDLNCKIDYYKSLKKQRELTEEEETELDLFQYEYARSKEYLNAVYGMLVSNDLNDENNIDELTEWYTKELTEEEQREKVHNSYCGSTAYKCYQWGVWCTANARLVLHQLGLFTDELRTGIYRDTDSIKTLLTGKKEELIRERVKILNDEIEKKVRNCGIDCVKEYEYKGYKRTYIIGQWEYEGMYDDFKTLGAKRYCVGRKIEIPSKPKKNLYNIDTLSNTCYEMELTVSGINKKVGAETLCKYGGIKYFKPNIVFKAGEGGKQCSHYVDRELHIIHTKVGNFEVASGICLTESGYNMTVSDTLLSLFDSFGQEKVIGENW